jgi:hypothetical protein
MGDKQFDPLKTCGGDYKFIITNPATSDEGILRLKAKIESDICDFVPAKYRKHVKRFMRLYDPPKECEAGWRYAPFYNVQKQRFD